MCPVCWVTACSRLLSDHTSFYLHHSSHLDEIPRHWIVTRTYCHHCASPWGCSFGSQPVSFLQTLCTKLCFHLIWPKYTAVCRICIESAYLSATCRSGLFPGLQPLSASLCDSRLGWVIHECLFSGSGLFRLTRFEIFAWFCPVCSRWPSLDFLMMLPSAVLHTRKSRDNFVCLSLWALNSSKV